MGKTRRSLDFPKPPLSNSQRKIDYLNQNSGESEMALHFVGKKRIAELHRDFFDDPTPTDCITFPYHDPQLLGEVFVCPEVALEYVQSEGGNLEEEITLYIVHGFLHLLGYDDIDPKECEQMREEETKWMAKLAKNHLRVRIIS